MASAKCPLYMLDNQGISVALNVKEAIFTRFKSVSTDVSGNMIEQAALIYLFCPRWQVVWNTLFSKAVL